MVVVPVRLGLSRWQVVLNGHPLTLAVMILCGLAGLVAVGWAVATLLLANRLDRQAQKSRTGRRTLDQLRRRARGRILLAVPALLVGLVAVSVLAWAQPYAATPAALSATRSGDAVRVTQRLTWYEMQGIHRSAGGREVKPTIGFVFSPGARVDARAYAGLLRPLAQAGYLVIVLKEPFGVALLDVGHAQAAISVHPEIRSWAVGGHSLGGVAAASFADSHAFEVKALVLYAGYPARTLTRHDLLVLSVSGSADGLATPAKVEAAKADLPPGTRYVVVQGGVHGFFGDYGDQSGDGRPSVDRAVAQGEIVSSTRAFLQQLVPVPEKPVPKKPVPKKR